MSQSNKPNLTPAQAFNMVAPAARSALLNAEQHEVLLAALLKIKELVEAAEATSAPQQTDAPAEATA